MNKQSLLKLGVAALLSVSAASAFAANPDPKFIETCSGCHGMDANGIPGMAPALNNPELWQKLGDQRQRYIAGIVTGGMSGKIVSKGQEYTNLVMPPFGYLSTDDLVEITNYIVHDLNQAGAGPDAALIEELKASPLSHKQLRQIRSVVN